MRKVGIMEWSSTAINAVVSIGVGVLLWMLLPRGVVLTRTLSGPDLWQVKNDSPLPVRIMSVRVVSPEEWNETTSRFDEPVLPVDGGIHGVSLSIDDEVADTARTDNQRPWSEVSITPGDTLTARVPTNTTLIIDYRRAGWLGILERRHLGIHGGA